MRLLLSGVATALALFLTAAPAAAQSFNCPLSEARRNIIDPIPSGWYTTTVRSRLVETRIDVIGGQSTMVCVYGEAGRVMREVPADQICTPRVGGFECAPGSGGAPAPASEPTLSGTLEIRSSYSFDLDAAVVGAAGADIWFESIRENENYLTPRNGARIAASPTEPGYGGCVGAAYSTTRLRLEIVGVGSYVCVRTSSGALAQFRIDTRASTRVLTITYALWR